MATGLAILQRVRISITSTLKTWAIVFIRPGEEAFTVEKNSSYATLPTALTWIILASVLATLLGSLRAKLVGMWLVPAPDLHPFSSASSVYIFLTDIYLWRLDAHFRIMHLFGKAWLLSDTLFDLAATSLGPLLSFLNRPEWHWLMRVLMTLYGPVFFFIGVCINHVFAYLLGGRGRLGRYAFLTAAFGAPIAIMRSLHGFLPLIGASLAAALPTASWTDVQHFYYGLKPITHEFIVAILALYGLALTCLAARVEYGLTSVRAIACVLPSSLVSLILRRGVVYAIFGLFFSPSMR